MAHVAPNQELITWIGGNSNTGKLKAELTMRDYLDILQYAGVLTKTDSRVEG